MLGSMQGCQNCNYIHYSIIMSLLNSFMDLLLLFFKCFEKVLWPGDLSIKCLTEWTILISLKAVVALNYCHQGMQYQLTVDSIKIDLYYSKVKSIEN